MAEKRKASDDGEQPARKGGFKIPDCPFSKAEFLSKAAQTTMQFELKPKEFSNGTYGYQKGGGIAKVEADGPDSTALGDKTAYVRPSCIAHFQASKEPLPTKAQFMKTATVLDTGTFEVWPAEFSTGSFGWHGHRKQEVTVGDKTFMLNLNVNAPINGSKDAKEEDPVLPKIEEDTVADPILKVLGQPKPGKGDDLTKLRGIGPWIAARLNKIKINSFEQIANMTMDMEKQVAEAIQFFPDRIHRDEWKYQAEKMKTGKWQELNPLYPSSGKTTTIEIDGVNYERVLIDIADYSMKDGNIEFFEAEALWWSATDGNRVTDLEKSTLEYILKSDKYKFDTEAESFLRSKTDSVQVE